MLLKKVCTNSARKGKKSHVAGGLPKPQQNSIKLGADKFETLYPYEGKIRIKELAGSSEVQ